MLTRQALPIIDRTKYASADGLEKGAYILADAKGKTPELILIATGSEVAPTLDAYEKLTAEGIAARLVSMPSWDLFENQPQSYRDEVLPPSVTARLAVEAGVTFGWERYVGTKGAVHRHRRFGASAPWKIIAEKLGSPVRTSPNSRTSFWDADRFTWSRADFLITQTGRRRVCLCRICRRFVTRQARLCQSGLIDEEGYSYEQQSIASSE